MTDKELELKILDTQGEIRVSISKDGCSVTLDGISERITDEQADIALWTLEQRMKALTAA